MKPPKYPCGKDKCEWDVVLKNGDVVIRACAYATRCAEGRRRLGLPLDSEELKRDLLFLGSFLGDAKKY